MGFLGVGVGVEGGGCELAGWWNVFVRVKGEGRSGDTGTKFVDIYVILVFFSFVLLFLGFLVENGVVMLVGGGKGVRFEERIV